MISILDVLTINIVCLLDDQRIKVTQLTKRKTIQNHRPLREHREVNEYTIL